VNAPQRNALLLLCFVSSLCGQNTVGGNAPNAPASTAFQESFFQNGFDLLVNPTPTINVSKLGSTGYYQTFTGISSSTDTLALILPSISALSTTGVLQVLSPMYTYYSGVTEAAAGYPTMNTAVCPGISGCQYQLFSNGYALFTYAAGTNQNGTGFTVSGAVYTLWNTLGGPTSALGMAYAAQAAVTSPAKTTANAQQFSSGMVVNLTSGINNGATYAVVEPIWDLYNADGGPAGPLGMPTSNDLTLADGSHKQTFEGGRVVYTSGNTPTIVLPVNEIDISPVGSVTLQFGQTITATVSVFDTTGQPAVGRTISWATSNSGAVTVTPNGYSATLKGVGSGIANITATSEGLVSKALVVTAVEPCCQIGQGAPTAAIQAAFQAAVARANLTVLIPAASPVRLLGAGYVQDLFSPDGTIHYLVALSQTGQIAYIVTGPILTAYTANGGPAGPLAYPAANVDSGGTQLFQNGALAGNPVQVVTGPVLSKWAATNYESGVLGPPAAPQMPFTSISGYTGYAQSFTGGSIFGISSGSLAGKGFLATGLILARYLALSGPGGEMGVPLSDPTTTAGVARQNFENGYIDLQPGASAAVEHLNPRVPTVTATPATVLPGGRVHIAITGFNNNATLTVSQTGQTNFAVTVPAGVYQWDAYIAPGAAAGAVTVKAADNANSSTNASATYTIRSIAAAQPQLNKYEGDNQTGPPGSTLSTPLIVTLTDNSNTPITGATVTFSASPGASASPASALTDSNGHAATTLRLPVTTGIAAVTAQALGVIAIFDAASSGSYSLPNYPQFAAATPTGSEVAAAASMIRYYQNLSAMPSANGQATPASLDQFLQTLPDGYLNSSQLVNLWRLVNFTGSSLYVSVENTDLTSIRTLTAAGDPVLLNLSLTQDGTPASGTTVVATGIAADGSVTILDPNTTFAQTDLNSYLNGFTVNGHAYRGTVLSALRLLPRNPPVAGFVVESISQPQTVNSSLSIQSAAGNCSSTLAIQNAYVSGSALPSPILTSQFVFCDGTQPVYQAVLASAGSLLDLTLTPGSGTTALTAGSSYQVAQSGGKWTVTPASLSFSSSGVLNAATFQPGISPGGIFSLFGAGLAGSASATNVSVGGQAAAILLATPFQINAQLPPATNVGTATIQVTSPYGTATQSIPVQATSPGIFVIGTASDGVSSLGAVVNQSGTINGPTAPAPRGTTITIYCTGLGATSIKNGLSLATGVVSGSLSSTSLPVAFAGLTPGFVGLYQVNLPIPAATPPGLLLPLYLESANVPSNTVVVAVQ
jgi:uncharacterized protein (TIGR03437 family)